MNFDFGPQDKEPFLLMTEDMKVAGYATLAKSAQISSQITKLRWIPLPYPGQTQQQLIINPTSGGSNGQDQPSSTPDHPPRNVSVATSEQPLRSGSLRSSVIEEDLGLSVTDDRGDEDDNMDDGGHSSTDQDDSGDLEHQLLDRLYMEEPAESVLRESSIFNASLGNGNHRRETLNHLFSNDSSMYPKKTVDASSKSLLQVHKQTKKDTRKSKKISDATREKVPMRSVNNNLDRDDAKNLLSPRTRRKSVRDPPADTSTPKPVESFGKGGIFVKCEYCGKKLLKKSMKQHVKKIHIDKLLKCRKCGAKYFREAALNVHEASCTITYEVHR